MRGKSVASIHPLVQIAVAAPLRDDGYVWSSVTESLKANTICMPGFRQRLNLLVKRLPFSCDRRDLIDSLDCNRYPFEKTLEHRAESAGFWSFLEQQLDMSSVGDVNITITRTGGNIVDGGGNVIALPIVLFGKAARS